MYPEQTYIGLAWSETDEFWWPGYERKLSPVAVWTFPQNINITKVHGTVKRHHDRLVLFATGALEIYEDKIVRYCSFNQPWLVYPGDEVKVELLRASMEKV